MLIYLDSGVCLGDWDPAAAAASNLYHRDIKFFVSKYMYCKDLIVYIYILLYPYYLLTGKYKNMFNNSSDIIIFNYPILAK